jgi:hypothetical protein
LVVVVLLRFEHGSGARVVSNRHAPNRGAGSRIRTVVRLVSVAAAALLVAGLAPVAQAGSPGHGPKAPENPGRRYNQDPPQGGPDPLWGIGVVNGAVDQDELQDAMGQTFQAEGIYMPLSGWNYPTADANRSKNNGARVYININSWRHVGSKKICYPYTNYLHHDYDAYLQKWVNDLLAFNYADTYLTFTHEPTVQSEAQPHCGTSAQYVQAFDYVFHYFRNHGVTYPFVWWMVASSFGQGYAQDWQPPASDFSVVAVDGYNRFLDGEWRTPEFIFTPAQDYAQDIGKPLIVGEIGSVEDPHNSARKGNWFIDAANLFRSWSLPAILWNDDQNYHPSTTEASLAGWVSASENSGSAFLANAQGTPGSSVSSWGAGFKTREIVDVHLDTLSGPVIGTATADGSGVIKPVMLHLPSPLAGGTHSLLAVGRSSGAVAKATLTVGPNDPSSFTIAAGDTYTYSGSGWVPNETVTVQFPGGSPTSAPADANGSVVIAAVSPPEPHDGGHLTITATSASLTVFFRGIPVQHAPDSGQPQQPVEVSVTGFGASENVNVKVDGTTEVTLATDQWGSADGMLPLATTFGRHTISFVGTRSGVAKNKSILLKATENLDPNSGPTGTVVHVTSGPGWKPFEHVQVKVGSVVYDTVLADANGVVDTMVPIDRRALGPVHVSLTGQSLKLCAMADFTVTA